MSTKYFVIPSAINTGPGKYYAKVHPNHSYTLDQIIKEMRSRGTGVSESDMRAALHIFFDVVSDIVAAGSNVNLPLANFRSGIVGSFTSKNDSFDEGRHYVKASVSVGKLLRQKMKKIKLEKIHRPDSMPSIYHFKDIVTGSTSNRVTPGGIGEMAGAELKFNKANPEEGVYFVGDTTIKTEIVVSCTQSKVIFAIPALPPGTYSLEVRKGYKSKAEIRRNTLPNKLTVI